MSLYLILIIVNYKDSSFFFCAVFPQALGGEIILWKGLFSICICWILEWYSFIEGEKADIFENYQSWQKNHEGDENCHILSDSGFVSI